MIWLIVFHVFLEDYLLRARFAFEKEVIEYVIDEHGMAVQGRRQVLHVGIVATIACRTAAVVDI